MAEEELEVPPWMMRKPLRHQLEDLYATWHLEYHGILHEQGLGKSKLTIDTAVSLYLSKKIDTLLVYAPSGSYLNWIFEEVPKDWPSKYPVKTGWWASSSLAPARKRLFEAENYDGMAIIAANIESLRTIRGRNWAALLARRRRVFLVIDESTKIANMGATQTKAAIKLGKLCSYRRILTGSAVSESPMMAWSQAEFLKPGGGLLGFHNPVSFKAYHCELEKAYNPYKKNKDGSRGGLIDVQKREETGTGKVPVYKNLDVLRRRLQTFCTRRTKAECLDLPERIYEKRTFRMSGEQLAAYAQMREESIAILNEESVVSATVVIAQLQRLQQIAAGFLPVPGEPEEVVEFDTLRVKILLDIIEDCQGKILVWSRWVPAIRRVIAALRDIYGHDAVAGYYGATKTEDRPKLVKRFEDPDDPLRILVANQQVAAYQLTLIQAHTSIFFTNHYSHDERDQAEARNHREGQKNVVTYFDILAEKSIDYDILHILRNKLDLKTQVLGDNWRKWI